MPCVLLTLASEGVRGEAFPPLDCKCLGTASQLHFTKTKTQSKLLTVAAVNHCF